mmetsp:Transcript_18598/g.39946  ORF Transcript_18598/g.39946 Transcript_18598/m.39946 type:complete len:82 (-) Transcript_18598:455-700(-)
MRALYGGSMFEGRPMGGAAEVFPGMPPRDAWHAFVCHVMVQLGLMQTPPVLKSLLPCQRNAEHKGVPMQGSVPICAQDHVL